MGINPNPRRPAPYISDADWAQLPASTKALFQMADFTDYYHVEEEPRGSNRGRWIDWFLAVAGTSRGQAWCAAALYTAFYLQGLKLRIQYPASVFSWQEFCTRNQLIVQDPQRGDVVMFIRPTGNHIGQVAEVFPDGSFSFYSGNTNEDGSREGYEMAKKTRDVDQYTHFARFTKFDEHVASLATAVKAVA